MIEYILRKIYFKSSISSITHLKLSIGKLSPLLPGKAFGLAWGIKGKVIPVRFALVMPFETDYITEQTIDENCLSMLSGLLMFALNHSTL